VISDSLAKRYARALLEVAAESQAAEAVLAELRSMAGLLAGHQELRRFLMNPGVRRRDVLLVVDDLASRLSVRPLTRTFLKVAAEAGRLGALEEILRAYEGLLDDRLGRVRADVTVAAPLSAAEEASLTEALEHLTGKRALLQVRQDPAILGGMIARVGSRIYDGSLTAQLGRLRRELAAGG